jgi:pimeloyl-ACP methyl ester carboxylesterase
MVGSASSAEVGKFLDVDGVQTFFMERGDGEAVVLIHGSAPGASAHGSWQPNLDPLARAGFWVIAYDQPGFGQSGLPTASPRATDSPRDASAASLALRVRHARAFVDALGLIHYHVIGSADGACVAARLALEDPRVDRLVLVSGGALAPSDSEEASGQSPLLDELAGLKPKTMLLWGKNDPEAGLERALLLFDRIPGAELHVFDGCGQLVQVDQATRFNQIVGLFLKAGA